MEEIAWSRIVEHINQETSHTYFYDLVHNKAIKLNNENTRNAVKCRMELLMVNTLCPFIKRIFIDLLDDLNEADEKVIAEKKERQHLIDMNSNLRLKKDVEKIKETLEPIPFEVSLDLYSDRLLKNMEYQIILTVMKKLLGHRRESAEALGISERGLSLILIRNGFTSDLLS